MTKKFQQQMKQKQFGSDPTMSSPNQLEGLTMSLRLVSKLPSLKDTAV